MNEERDAERAEQQRRGDRRTVIVLSGFAALVLVIGLAVSVYEIGFNQHEAPDEAQAPQPTATEAAPSPAADPGADLFTENCGSCHTLAAAGTSGTIGPNLDDLQLDQATVLSTIKEGPAEMPSNLVTGAEAQQVAAFVASSAGG
jgi:mono/diheme cytochrome c family protein